MEMNDNMQKIMTVARRLKLWTQVCGGLWLNTINIQQENDQLGKDYTYPGTSLMHRKEMEHQNIG